MALDIKEVLKELCEVPGPSGFEEEVVLRAKKLVEPYMDETWVDTLGNLMGVRKCGKPGAKKLLIDAHIDEIGFVVTAIEEGFLKFSALGGLDARLLPAAGVTVMTEPVMDGVVCVLPPHILRPEDTEKVTKIDELYIDIGLSQEEAERLIPIGTAGVLASNTRDFGENQICSKALDNRAGFAAILGALELIKNESFDDIDLYVMASVQEEVGMRGAGPGAFAVSPDYCIVVDVGEAKTPDATDYEIPEKMGEGVIVARGPNMNRAFTDMIINIAREKEINHQITVIPGGSSGTNTKEIQISQCGVATAFVAIPIKYVHSANEVVLIDDIESTAKLLGETIKSVKGA
ncbi:MAG: M20/M25/M40 family metallo-hydrolase [Oscillospiraceae bacterium]|nr:M20/M25/M40 family metallo-hydrolase [Oscillospiraceae bacterium]MCL2279132.1 M20/M25/M40 family metallo-hydrolase [Oscillospiraceae bacterium]